MVHGFLSLSAISCCMPVAAVTEAPLFLGGDSPHLQYTGRVAKQGSRVLWEWTGIKAATLLNCPAASLSVQFHIDVAVWKGGWPTEELEKYAVLVNGTHIANFQTNPKVSIYNITLPRTPAGAHLVELLKLSERISIPILWSMSEGEPATAFNGITIPGSCSPLAPERPSRRIEFIGDSITCGFGNLARNVWDRAKCLAPPNGWRDYEDFSVTSASLAANAFHAELHTQCISQIGITRNGNTVGRTTAFNMSHYVHRTLPTLADPTLKWHYASWVPDLAVVNLGTNDYDLAEKFNIQPTFTDFESNYTLFLNDYISDYRGLLKAIVVACGPMTKTHCPSVAKVAATLNTTFAALKVMYVELSLKNLGGCLSHPDVAGHHSIYETLAPIISDLTGWDRAKTTLFV